MTATSDVQMRTVDQDTYAMLCAWILVLNRVGAGDVRFIAIMAMDDFSGHACIDCLTCHPAGDWPMTVTRVVEHRRRPGRHRLTLNQVALRVIP